MGVLGTRPVDHEVRRREALERKAHTKKLNKIRLLLQMYDAKTIHKRITEHFKLDLDWLKINAADIYEKVSHLHESAPVEEKKEEVAPKAEKIEVAPVEEKKEESSDPAPKKRGRPKKSS